MERRPRRRTTPRLAGRLLACAVVPALLIAGCSSGSGGSGSAKPTGAPSSASQTPALAAGKYSGLPAACSAVARATVSALVPKAKHTAGTQAKSSDLTTRAGCSWTGNGKDGYQYRWLSVTLQRFASSTALGAAEAQARQRYTEQVSELGKARGFTTASLSGIGDQADLAGGKATVAKVTSQNATVVARSGNVVVIVEYDGAGLEGKRNPSAAAVQGGAQRAAKDAVAALAAAHT